MKKSLLLAIGGIGTLVAIPSANADQFVDGGTFSATLVLHTTEGDVLGFAFSGSIDNSGNDTPNDSITGVSGSASSREYFNFDLTGYQYFLETGGGPIELTSADIQLDVKNVVGGSQAVSFMSWNGTHTYDALGTGTIYGDQTYTTSEDGQTVITPLNAAALADITQSAPGGEFLVSAADLNTLPEPMSTSLLLVAGLAALCERRRCRCARNSSSHSQMGTCLPNRGGLCRSFVERTQPIN